MRKHSTFLALLLIGSSIHSQDVPPKHMRIALRHIEAGGIGYKKGYTTLEGFFARDPGMGSYVPFLDVRGHVFNDGKFAVNAGVGARTNWGCRAYGINAYYDYRNTHRKAYNQIGIGLETLGTLWDFRINGYIPLGATRSGLYDPKFGGFTGHSVLVARKFEFAMDGADAEFGFHFGKKWDLDFYTAAGPYYFKGDAGKGAIGGKARIGAYYKEYVGLEFSDSFDNVFHNNFQGELTISIPFGPRSTPKVTKSCCPDTCDFATTLSARMVQPVSRQEIVVIDTHTEKDPASNFFVFVDNRSSSLGTFESPYPTLLEAENNSNPGDIIYVFAGNGTTDGMDAGITLQVDQKFWGSGVSHNLVTNLGTISIPPQSESNPIITNTGGNGVTLADGNDVSGFTISRASSNGIRGEEISNTTLSDTTVFGCGVNGILITNSAPAAGTLQISRISADNNSNDGINVSNPFGVGVIVTDSIANNNGISAPAGVGIHIDAGDYPASITVQNNFATHNSTNGILIVSNLDASHEGVLDLNISQNTAGSTVSGNGINFTFSGNSEATSTVLISRNTLLSNSLSGISATLSPSGTGTLNLTVRANESAYCSLNGIIILYNASAAYNFNSLIERNTSHNNENGGIVQAIASQSIVRTSVYENILYKNMPHTSTAPGNANFTINTGIFSAGSLCLDLQRNTSDTGYSIAQNFSTVMNIAPNGATGAEAVNIGPIYTSGTVGSVATCTP